LGRSGEARGIASPAVFILDSIFGATTGVSVFELAFVHHVLDLEAAVDSVRIREGCDKVNFFTFRSDERLAVYKALKDESRAESIRARRLKFLKKDPFTAFDLEKRRILKLGIVPSQKGRGLLHIRTRV